MYGIYILFRHQRFRHYLQPRHLIGRAYHRFTKATILVKDHTLQVFFKVRQLLHYVAACIHHQRSAIKHYIRMRPYGIAIHHRQLVFLHITLYYTLAALGMYIIKWRCTQVDHHIRLLLYQLIHRAMPVHRVIGQVPDILADGHRQFLPLKLHYIPAIGRLKVAILVKYIVVGQQRFVHHSLYLLAMQKVGTVKQILTLNSRVARRAAHQHTYRICHLPYPLYTRQARLYKIIELQEISRRVTAYR